MNIPHQGKVIVVGAGGHAREVAWLVRECAGGADLVGFIDDADTLQKQNICGAPVLGTIAEWPQYTDCTFVVAIGTPRVRRNIVARMAAIGVPRFATLVHRSVAHSGYVDIGAGSMIAAGCVLTTQVNVGQHVIINTAAIVSHDARLDDYVSIAPGVSVSGNVHVGAGSELGTGVSIRQGIRIGCGAIVGMGSVVVKDVVANTVVVGNPAKPLRTLDAF